MKYWGKDPVFCKHSGIWGCRDNKEAFHFRRVQRPEPCRSRLWFSFSQRVALEDLEGDKAGSRSEGEQQNLAESSWMHKYVANQDLNQSIQINSWESQDELCIQREDCCIQDEPELRSMVPSAVGEEEAVQVTTDHAQHDLISPQAALPKNQGRCSLRGSFQLYFLQPPLDFLTGM